MVVDQHTKPLLGARILVVEDEYYLAADLSRALSDAGAEVVGPIGSLQEAQATVNSGRFDCAVVDMNLRGSVAHSVAERLGERGVPFLIATGYDRASLPESLQHAPRVEKPFTPYEVIDRLVNLRAGNA
jgi:DNA-binding response OmpR family regulator